MVPIDSLRLAPDNVREELGDLTSLADSIATKGILTALKVSRAADGVLEVVCGNRRLAAARIAGLDYIPVVEGDQLVGAARIETMLAENDERHDLTVRERARAYRRLMKEHGLSQDEVARRVHRSQTTISNHLAFLELPEHMQRQILNKEIGLQKALDAYRRRYEPRKPKPAAAPTPVPMNTNRGISGSQQVLYAKQLASTFDVDGIAWHEPEVAIAIARLFEALRDYPLDLTQICPRCGDLNTYVGRCCDEHEERMCTSCSDSLHRKRVAS